jgi:hypothetical protein
MKSSLKKLLFRRFDNMAVWVGIVGLAATAAFVPILSTATELQFL